MSVSQRLLRCDLLPVTGLDRELGFPGTEGPRQPALLKHSHTKERQPSSMPASVRFANANANANAPPDACMHHGLYRGQNALLHSHRRTVGLVSRKAGDRSFQAAEDGLQATQVRHQLRVVGAPVLAALRCAPYPRQV